VASVTTILSILSKPQLITWRIKQAILASLTMPRPSGMDEDEWISAIVDDANRQGSEAADLGTKIHAQVQRAYEGELWSPEYEPYCVAVFDAIRKEFGDKKWIAEKSFAHPLGFGGKVDLCSEDQMIVNDFKTTSLNGDKLKKSGYSEHLLQLAGYRLGLGFSGATLINTYISTSKPGDVFIKIYTEEESSHATLEWLALLEYWKLSKRFDKP
jgi:hypothetical protein